MKNKEQYLRLTLFFKPTNKKFDTPVEDYIVGVVQKILGKNNKWHDSFSPYNISSLLGGVVDGNNIIYKNGGYFHITSIEPEFLSVISQRITEVANELFLRDMAYDKFLITFENVHTDYDIVKSVSPILLKTKEKYLTFEDDNFIETLTNHCKAKLLHNGCTNNDIKTFSIVPFHFENAKVKYTKRKNYALPANKIMLVINGKPKCRRILYQMGIGSSTGYCYGTVEIVNMLNENKLKN